MVRHGFGYSVFENAEDGIASELWIYVAADAPVKFAESICETIRAPAPLVCHRLLGMGPGRTAPKELHARRHRIRSADRRGAGPQFLQHGLRRTACLCRRDEPTAHRSPAIARSSSAVMAHLAKPAAMGRERACPAKSARGWMPAPRCRSTLICAGRAGREIVFRLGAGRDRDDAQTLLQRFRRADASRDALCMGAAYWNHTLGAVQVETPDPALNVLANGWLLYQTLSCRLWARTGFINPAAPSVFAINCRTRWRSSMPSPRLLREHLLRAAAHQFREGDVQHWWHPPAGRGVRTHFSDDYLWLPYATCRYVEAIGDTGVLDETSPFPRRPPRSSPRRKPITTLPIAPRNRPRSTSIVSGRSSTD